MSALGDLKFAIEEHIIGARIKVIGVGGGGGNAVNRMVTEGVEGVEFYVLNTDAQALAASVVPNKMQLGEKITQGKGAGANPEVGRQAALEDTERICEMLEGADMVFVTAGLGGGTGTGAAPVVASLAKELGALTIAVVTKPFAYEGSRKSRVADHGLAELASICDTVIAIPNDRLLALVPRGASFVDGLQMADDVLRQAVQGISDIIVTPGLINRDFADIKMTMSGMGYAMMGTATASGDGAAVEAARQAINCPLLEDSRIKGSRGILINITGSSRLGLHEVNEACSIIREAADTEDAQINFGVIIDDSMDDSVKVTVIATGFQPENSPPPMRRHVSSAPPIHVPPPAPVEIEQPVAAMPAPEPEPARHAMPAPRRRPHDYDPDDLDTPAYLRQGKLIQ